MSLKDFRGAAYAFAQWNQQVKDEIARGERKGATVLHKWPNKAKTEIGWFKRRLLLGEFRKRA